MHMNCNDIKLFQEACENVSVCSLAQEGKKHLVAHVWKKRAAQRCFRTAKKYGSRKGWGQHLRWMLPTSFRKLSHTQKIYAKKAIEDILVLGQLKSHFLHSVNIGSASTHSSTSSTSVPILQNISSSCPPRITNPTSTIHNPISPQSHQNAMFIPNIGVRKYTNIFHLFNDKMFS